MHKNITQIIYFLYILPYITLLFQINTFELNQHWQIQETDNSWKLYSFQDWVTTILEKFRFYNVWIYTKVTFTA